MLLRGTLRKMLRVLSFVLWTVLLACTLHVAVTVPLGNHTFFEHARRIWGTPEAQDLSVGIQNETERVGRKAVKQLNPSGEGSKP